MTTETKIDGNTLVITVSGAVNTLTAPDLENVVRNNYTDPVNITFDLKDVDYISSAGLRVILLSKKMANTKGGEVKIVNAQPEVEEVFDMTGFYDFLLKA